MESKKESLASMISVVVFGFSSIAIKMLAIAYAFNSVIAPHFGLPVVTPGFVFVSLLLIGVAVTGGRTKQHTNKELIKSAVTVIAASMMLFVAAYFVA